VSLPLLLARLAPGEHLLTVRADVKGTTEASVERNLRFSATRRETAAGLSNGRDPTADALRQSESYL